MPTGSKSGINTLASTLEKGNKLNMTILYCDVTLKPKECQLPRTIVVYFMVASLVDLISSKMIKMQILNHSTGVQRSSILFSN
jgi:hypothetical protein